MDINTVEEIIACLQGDRTLFHYFKDRYAVYLLQRRLRHQGQISINELRREHCARLLERPTIKNLLKQSGHGRFRLEDLDQLWPQNPEPFVLTLGRWGSKEDYKWAQTSRPGTNLVLQLNIAEHRSQPFEQLLHESPNSYAGYCHPVSTKRSGTLAWARMDMDMQSGTLLIEEIQSDLIRDLDWLYQLACKYKNQNLQDTAGFLEPVRGEELMQVCASIRDTMQPIWQEAIMTAVIWFAFEELGMETLFFHSYNTGNVMKNLRYSRPPKSLYSQVPKRFCFEETAQGPHFILQDKQAKRRLKKVATPMWYCMAA